VALPVTGKTISGRDIRLSASECGRFYSVRASIGVDRKSIGHTVA
jgi:hypothetical protein